MLTNDDLQFSLSTAAASVRFAVKHGCKLKASPRFVPFELQNPYGAFVTLYYDDEVAGCQGTTNSGLLFNHIITSAFDSATKDLRFAAITENHYPKLKVQVHILKNVHTIVSDEALIEELASGTHSVSMTVPGTGIKAFFLPEYALAYNTNAALRTALKVKARIQGEVPNSTFRFSTIETQSSEKVLINNIPELILRTRED